MLQNRSQCRRNEEHFLSPLSCRHNHSLAPGIPNAINFDIHTVHMPVTAALPYSPTHHAKLLTKFLPRAFNRFILINLSINKIRLYIFNNFAIVDNWKKYSTLTFNCRARIYIKAISSELCLSTHQNFCLALYLNGLIKRNDLNASIYGPGQ